MQICGIYHGLNILLKMEIPEAFLARICLFPVVKIMLHTGKIKDENFYRDYLASTKTHEVTKMESRAVTQSTDSSLIEGKRSHGYLESLSL